MTVETPDLSEERWAGLRGGYRIRYDPRKALRLLEEGRDIKGAWGELWNELHHQGDIGEASFAAIPGLVGIHERRGIPDWNTYVFAATIELARGCRDNPDLPPDLRHCYEAAWTRLVAIGLRELPAAEDANLVAAIIGVLAIAKGQRTIGRFTIELTEDERLELLA